MTKKIKHSLEKLTSKQKNLVQEVVQNVAEKGGRTKKEMLKNAGYGKHVQATPEKAFRSPKIVQALEALGIDDDFLALKRKQHLDARKIEYKNLYIKWGDY